MKPTGPQNILNDPEKTACNAVVSKSGGGKQQNTWSACSQTGKKIPLLFQQIFNRKKYFSRTANNWRAILFTDP